MKQPSLASQTLCLAFKTSNSPWESLPCVSFISSHLPPVMYYHDQDPDCSLWIRLVCVFVLELLHKSPKLVPSISTEAQIAKINLKLLF